MSNARVSTPVRVEKLRKRFNGSDVVAGVSFDVYRGSCFGLIGPNGAGKSTTLKMIYGFLVPTGGKVVVNDIDVVLNPRRAKSLIGVAPQDDDLDPDLTVGQNLLFHARYRGWRGGEARARVARVLERMGLEERAGEQVMALSTGMRRRLVLGRALLDEPDVIVLDEPTRGLDRASRREYLKSLSALKEEGATLLLATHEMEEAQTLCDRIAIMERGVIRAEGEAAEILRVADEEHLLSGGSDSGG